MTVPRSQLVDVEVTRYYHCISRCVRRAMLCGKGFEHRKAWIEERLEKLAEHFAVAVCGFAVMDNHLHVLVRLDPARSKDWDAEEVARRWVELYPPSELDPEDEKTLAACVAQLAKDKKKIEKLRARLGNLGWFMKALKEPLARMANKEDNCKGTFWESRYKSIAILDEEALLATCAYIDLNPVAAGIAATPETSPHTSVRQRVAHARELGKLDSLKEAAKGSIAGSRAAGKLEESHWLCPLEDRRSKGSLREGMLENFSLGSYLLLVDYTSRLYRSGKARVSDEVAGILDRLGTSAEFWEAQIRSLFGKARLMGTYFSASRDRLRELARQKGVRHLDNAVPLATSG
jgi:REP element-mobilizing transposase RayT